MKYFNDYSIKSKKEENGQGFIKFRKEFAFYLVSTLTIFVFGLVGFSVVEQGIVLAADSAVVHIRQQITAELALTVAETELTLSPNIPGLTGGQGDASDVVTVVTNNNTGYKVTVVSAGSPTAPGRMMGETQGGFISDYGSFVPQTWSDTTAGQNSQYGFGITNGAKPNIATGFNTCAVENSCWARVPTTTPMIVMNVSTETLIAGDDFTLKFRVHLPANASPLPPEDFYSATTTITAIMN